MQYPQISQIPYTMMPSSQIASLVVFYAALACSVLPPCAGRREVTADVGSRVARRLQGDGCDGYTETVSVNSQASLQNAIDGSSSICIEITADLYLVVPGFAGVTALGVASGKSVRLWSSNGAKLDGQGSAPILTVESNTVVELEGLRFYDGYVSAD